jgi:hypothetical protein
MKHIKVFRKLKKFIDLSKQEYFIQDLKYRIALRIGKVVVKVLEIYPSKKIYFLTHNAGLFSCMSVALDATVRTKPQKINSMFGLAWYKKILFINNWNYFFQEADKDKVSDLDQRAILELDISSFWSYRYDSIPIKNFTPFVNTYFRPSIKIQNIKRALLDSYELNPLETIGVHHRGTDKITEWDLTPINRFGDEIEKLLSSNLKNTILVQSDDNEARRYLSKRFSKEKVVIFEEILPGVGSVGAHLIDSYNQQEQVFLYFATVLILSECNFLITHTGNAALWECLIRNNTDKVIQL